MKHSSSKCYVQSLNQKERKLNSTIITISVVHTLTDDEIVKSPFNKADTATVKNKWNSKNITRVE